MPIPFAPAPLVYPFGLPTAQASDSSYALPWSHTQTPYDDLYYWGLNTAQSFQPWIPDHQTATLGPYSASQPGANQAYSDRASAVPQLFPPSGVHIPDAVPSSSPAPLNLTFTPSTASHDPPLILTFTPQIVIPWSRGRKSALSNPPPNRSSVPEVEILLEESRQGVQGFSSAASSERPDLNTLEHRWDFLDIVSRTVLDTMRASITDQYASMLQGNRGNVIKALKDGIPDVIIERTYRAVAAALEFKRNALRLTLDTENEDLNFHLVLNPHPTAPSHLSENRLVANSGSFDTSLEDDHQSQLIRVGRTAYRVRGRASHYKEGPASTYTGENSGDEGDEESSTEDVESGIAPGEQLRWCEASFKLVTVKDGRSRPRR